jgi:glucose/arabinose dehydrogenase
MIGFMRLGFFSCVLITLFAVSGCGANSAPPTPAPAPGAGESITGRERIGWDQQAADAAQLATFRYAMYVDGTRNELADVSCTVTATAAGFACNARLPTLSAGAHSLELTAYITDDGVLESARSAPLLVTVVASSAPAVTVEWEGGHIETTSDALRLRLDKLAVGFEEPLDASFAPDGRLFIAERTGRIRIVERGQLQPVDALTMDALETGDRDRVLSIAIDPDFSRTHFIFVVQTAQTSSGPVYRLTRYRELEGRLAQRAILLETGSASSAQPAAVLRIGPDGKLYLAFDGQPANGRLLRLNADGTMPRDQAGTTPALATGIQSPRGMGWDPRSRLLWIADDDGEAEGHLSGITTTNPPVRAVVRGRHALRDGSGSLVFYESDVLPPMRGDALLASSWGRHILRLRFAADDPTRISSSEPLLQDRVGTIRVVAPGPDGAIYFLTNDSLGRLVPER